MLYIKQTLKSVDQAFQDMEASITKHGFGLPTDASPASPTNVAGVTP